MVSKALVYIAVSVARVKTLKPQPFWVEDDGRWTHEPRLVYSPLLEVVLGQKLSIRNESFFLRYGKDLSFVFVDVCWDLLFFLLP